MDELREAELVRFTATMPGLPTVHEAWHYMAIDDNSFELKSVQETDEATNFFGKVIDRTLLPRVIQRDLERTLDNLDDIFSIGVPD